MTKFSEKMKKQGKINTQMALFYLESVYGLRVYGRDRNEFIKRIRKEVPGEKTGTGKGTFWYFKINDLRLFAEAVQVEATDGRK
ncbi:MAG: hypothetical protein K0M69_15875 [Youngiibacter sp.]|nr:hypothetical protein [Youngiibacter sp.]